MKIAVSTTTRFHMFDLARQIVRQGNSLAIYTGYPSFLMDPDLRPYARTHPGRVILENIRWRFPPPPRTTWWADQTLEDFGQWLGRNISPEMEILDALAGTGLEAGRALRKNGRPWICNRGSTHILTQKQTLEEEHARWGVPAPFYSSQGLSRALAEYEEADAIVVPSEFARNSFLKRGFPSEKISCCPYGVDLSLFSPRNQSSKNHPFRVVFLSGCSVRKGIGYLLEAMRPLVLQKAAETWLIGSVHEQARPLLARHSGEFILHGVQPRAKLVDYLSKCDVMVLPSVEEGLALVIAQAMACGLPVIATPNTGADELMEDGIQGFIVPARNAEAIREKVLWLRDHPDRRARMGVAAMERVRSLGGWGDYGRRALQLYRELIARQGRAV